MRWAISDIHGCKKTLEVLIGKVRQKDKSAKFYFLGDYIDRGPDSKGVLDIVMDEAEVALVGNHELMCVDAHKNPTWHSEALWFANGGRECVSSFGCEVIPDEYIEWMMQLPRVHKTDVAYLVHAGLYPGVDIDNQAEDCVVWVREEFIDSDYEWDKPVIHGHTPSYTIQYDGKRRVGIDTGCVYRSHGYGHLTALNIDKMTHLTVENID